MEISQVLVGAVTLPAQHPRAGERCPLYAYVVHHPEGPVLVDTGCGRGQHSRLDELYDPGDIRLADALREGAGVDLGDVDLLVLTHLHFDHAGRIGLLPGTPVVVQHTELRAAQTEERYTLPGLLETPGVVWHVVDGEAELRPGLRVLPTPSHTPGHQSVVVEGPDGVEVVAGQALYDPWELEHGTSREPEPYLGAEPADVTAARIRALGPRRVWFSHHPDPWTPSEL